MWAWLGGAVASLLASGAARFAATKVILTFLCLTVLPILLNNVIYHVIDQVLEAVTTLQGDVNVGSSAVVQFSGLTGWLLNNLSIPEGISIFLSAVAIKFTLGMIPFTRL